MKLVTKTLLCIAFFNPTFLFANIIYVNHAATGLNNGTSWQNAFVDLQDALNSTPTPDTIWIAEGTYFPTDGTDRYIYFQIPNGVAIYGGFEGTETQLDQRDWETNQTILSGDIGEQGDHSDNSFTILYATQTDTTTLIDGLNIMFGNANSTVNIEPTYGPTKGGGGFYVDGQGTGNSASIKIYNCTFTENFALVTGGAILFDGYSGSTGFKIFNTIFENNNTPKAGGAISKLGGCNNMQTITSCRFENNSAGEYGGAYSTNEYGVAIDLIIENSQFIDNFAILGGAIAKYQLWDVNYNNLIITNSLFKENKASSRGGVISDEAILSEGEIHLIQCDFQMNRADLNGGVLYLETIAPKDLFLSNCIFNQNSSGLSGGMAHLTAQSTNLNINSKNNLFIDNEASSGACFLTYGSNSSIKTNIINNTFFKNHIIYNGSVYSGNGEIKVLNSIFRENEEKLFSFSGSLDIGASLFDVDSCGSISGANPPVFNCQQSNLFNTDPMFRDTANLDFSLLSCSPAINAGNTAIIDSLGILEDLSGNDRVINGIVDIGAFEQEIISATSDSIQHETCFGISNGAVYLNNSGNPPFDVLWESDGESGINTNNLAPGAYDFFITDADGCSDSLVVEIEAATPLITTFDSIQHESCFGISNGEVYISSSGNPPFDISWQSGNNSGTNTTDLSPGLYDFTLIDADGCSDTLSVEIDAGTALMTYLDSIQHESCLENSNGAVYLSSSGNPPFDISWQNGNDNGTNTTGLSPGIYDFILIDEDGCSDTMSVEIEAATPLIINLESIQHESCFGNSNGAVYLSSSGNPPFDISWQSGNENGTNTTGLSPGIYDIIIIDADGCSDSLSVEIEAATALTTNFESTDASGSEIADGSIFFEVISGGTPGYTYEWSTGATTASISDLIPGNYFLTVTDAINCRYGFSFYVGGLTGLDDLEGAIDFQIQPNPAHNFLTIKTENPVSETFEIQLFDELGRLVLKRDLPFSQNSFRLNLEQIPAGFYHYFIANDRSVVKTGKLVVF